MRVLAAALAVLLLVAICSLAEANPRNSRSLHMQETIPICCFTYVSRRIPFRVISSAYMTSSSCSVPAMVLVTRKGRQLCADPRAPWVQELLEHLEQPEY